MGHDAGYKCGIINGPLSIFGDLERPQDSCRSDIERSVLCSRDESSGSSQLL